VVAAVVSRGVLPLVCGPGFPAARPDGLGAVVAGSVTGIRYAVAVALLAGTTFLVLAALQSGGELMTREAQLLLLTAPLGLAAAAVLALRAQHRFGGVTGDVYGAAVETTFTAVLVVAALAG
jgi:adenosylcobinamide-GDP ribazoletransferase